MNLPRNPIFEDSRRIFSEERGKHRSEDAQQKLRRQCQNI